LLKAELGMLVLEGELTLSVKNGTVLYSRAKHEGGSSEPLPLEGLIETMRDLENRANALNTDEARLD
jgi:hypothetical protein